MKIFSIIITLCCFIIALTAGENDENCIKLYEECTDDTLCCKPIFTIKKLSSRAEERYGVECRTNRIIGVPKDSNVIKSISRCSLVLTFIPDVDETDTIN